MFKTVLILQIGFHVFASAHLFFWGSSHLDIYVKFRSSLLLYVVKIYLVKETKADMLHVSINCLLHMFYPPPLCDRLVAQHMLSTQHSTSSIS